jgi:hypothetical protein
MNISLDACPNSAGINVFGANWRTKRVVKLMYPEIGGRKTHKKVFD